MQTLVALARCALGAPLVVLGSTLNEIARWLIIAGAFVWGVEVVEDDE